MHPRVTDAAGALRRHPWLTALGVLLLGERPGWAAYAALALILGGVALATTTRRT